MTYYLGNNDTPNLKTAYMMARIKTQINSDVVRTKQIVLKKIIQFFWSDSWMKL